MRYSFLYISGINNWFSQELHWIPLGSLPSAKAFTWCSQIDEWFGKLDFLEDPAWTVHHAYKLTWISVSTVTDVSTDSILANTSVSAGVWDALIAILLTVPSLPGIIVAETQVTVDGVLTPSTVQTGRGCALIDVLLTVSSSKPVI